MESFFESIGYAMTFFPDFSELMLFLTATLILNFTPGTDVLYIANRSLTQDKLHGVMAAFGISTGIVIHVLIVALGVGEVLRYSPVAFWILKFVGATYLLYLSYKAFMAKDFVLVTSSEKIDSKISKTYFGGILTTLLNPKIILFFLTFFSQFVDINKGNITLQLIFLGSLFIFSGTLINLSYVFFFSFFKEVFLKSTRLRQGVKKLTGLLFGMLAIKMFLAENR